MLPQFSFWVNESNIPCSVLAQFLASLSWSNQVRILSLMSFIFFLCSHRRGTILRAATMEWKLPLNSRKRAASFAVCFCEDQGLTVRRPWAGHDWTMLSLLALLLLPLLSHLSFCHALLPALGQSEFLAPLIFFHWQISDATSSRLWPFPDETVVGKHWFYKSRWRTGCWCIVAMVPAANVHLKKIPHLCFNRLFWAHNCQNWSIPSWRPGSSRDSGSGRRAWSDNEPVWELRGTFFIIPFYFQPSCILRQSHDLIISRGIL